MANVAYGLSTPHGDDWRDRAACRNPAYDPEIFFHGTDTALSRAMSDLAKAICGRCPVLADCRQWVAAHPQEFGVWAQMTPPERRARRVAGTRWCYCGKPFTPTVANPVGASCPNCERANAGNAANASRSSGSYRCGRNHEMTPENTSSNGNGATKCKRCSAEQKAESRAAARAAS